MSAKIVGPQAGKAGHLGGIGVRFMAWAAETGGGFSLVEHPMAPRALAAPLHRHTHEDEYSYVLEGRMGADLGGEVVYAEPGDLVFKPRGQWHAFWNAGDEPVHFLEVVTPGAFAGYFEDVAPVLDRPGPPDVATLGAIAGRYGLAMQPETIGRLAAAHALRI